MILLAESTKQFGSFLQRLRRHVGSVAQLHRTFLIDQQRPTQHAMFAHQIFGSGHLRFIVCIVFPTFVRFGWCRPGASDQDGTGAKTRESGQPLSSVCNHPPSPVSDLLSGYHGLPLTLIQFGMIRHYHSTNATQIRNRELTGVPARAARVGWWCDRVQASPQSTSNAQINWLSSHQPLSQS